MKPAQTSLNLVATVCTGPYYVALPTSCTLENEA